MMNAEKKKINEDPPQLGKTIVILEGEILSVKLNQWGFVGKLKTKYGDYSYKLKDSISTSLTANLVKSILKLKPILS